MRRMMFGLCIILLTTNFQLQHNNVLTQTEDNTKSISDWQWSPDGKWFAFVADSQNASIASQSYLLETSGNILRTFSELDHPVGILWSPNSQWVLFYEFYSKEFLVVNVDANIKPRYVQTEAVWDNQSVTFLSDTEVMQSHDNSIIYDMRNDKWTPLNHYFPNFDWVKFQSWSPDNQHMLFLAGSDNEHFSAYIAKRDGTELQKLQLSSDMDSKQITWSPDGKWIVWDPLSDDRIEMSSSDGKRFVDLPNIHQMIS